MRIIFWHRCLKKAVSNLEKSFGNIFDIRLTSDWNIYASIAYAQIHHRIYDEFEQFLDKLKFKTEKEINSFLKKFSLSNDGKNIYLSLLKKNFEFRKLLTASLIKTNK